MNPSIRRTVISTWLVEDSNQNATYFPQMRGESSDSGIKLAYWRCVFVFFATSLAVNQHASHRLYTNVTPPNFDGIDGAAVLVDWGVEIVVLPITFRLKKGSVNKWGNQFYILDVLRRISESDEEARHIILDSDCVWNKSVKSIEEAVDKYRILTYDVYRENRDSERKINGVSERDLTEFVKKQYSMNKEITYCGGEFFAATTSSVRILVNSMDHLWGISQDDVLGAPQEEAHFLSVLYGIMDIEIGTADKFIRRIWTSVRGSSTRTNDIRLTIWHLPAEKRLGFSTSFANIRAAILRKGDLPFLVKQQPYLRRHFGVPKRSVSKFVNDIIRLSGLRLARWF